jgi:hypothetical protein
MSVLSSQDVLISQGCYLHVSLYDDSGSRDVASSHLVANDDAVAALPTPRHDEAARGGRQTDRQRPIVAQVGVLRGRDERPSLACRGDYLQACNVEISLRLPARIDEENYLFKVYGKQSGSFEVSTHTCTNMGEGTS